MKFEIAHAEAFPLELGRAPKKVHNAYQKSILPVLQSTPDSHDLPKIKKLHNYKNNLWRMRVSDEYRLIYCVNRIELLVTLLMLDHREKVYDRLGANADGTPGIRIVARAEELLELKPSAQAIGEAELELAAIFSPPEPNKDRELPMHLTFDLLTDWNIPKQYHLALSSVNTEGDLLGLSAKMPQNILERVLNAIWPPLIEEVVQKPVRLAENPQYLDEAAEGQRDLDSFLLKLDEEQTSFVSRFNRVSPRGPWLIKGGPGSGKSTVALYCIRSLVNKANEQLPELSGNLNILFTTFTKSLVRASNHLLTALQIQGGQHTIDIINVDKLSYQLLPDKWKTFNIANSRELQANMALSIEECSLTDKKLPFDANDQAFLLYEIDWIIVGQGLRDIEEYLNADRTGRGRALGSQQRRYVWQIYETFIKNLRNQGKCMFSEWLHVAQQKVSPRYDYVFIDEAQDLKPVAIRFCMGLCRDPAHIFLTADSNQSIYGNGLSWSRVSTELRFNGKARIFRRNYRTTKEIWHAIKQIAPNTADIDRETMEVETVYNGPYPIYARYSSINNQSKMLNEYLHEAILQERVTPGCAAVLCQTDYEMNFIIKLIDEHLNPKIMRSNEVDLAYPGVKVMTMHSAKGLQFPIVAVVGVEAGRMPLPAAHGTDESEHNTRQQRLLFVACSRAMRRMMVLGKAYKPSPFMSKVTDEYWQIEDL